MTPPSRPRDERATRLPRRAAVVAAAAVALAVSAVAVAVLPQQQGTVDLLTQANITVNGSRDLDASGFSVAGAGDVNGDGRDDVIIGARGADPGAPSRAGAGMVYVVYGAASSTSVDLRSLGSRGFLMEGDNAGDESGFSVAGAGDVNGDGRDDVIIGAWGADPQSRSGAGESYVVYGSAEPGNFKLSTLAGSSSRGFIIRGARPGDNSGISVAGAGDVNGDGRDDVIIGANGADTPPVPQSGAGASYVVYGAASSATVDLLTLDAGRGFIIYGDRANDNSGVSVAGAGDVNGDGRDDVIIGANGADPGGVGSPVRSEAGVSYVVYGAPNTDLEVYLQVLEIIGRGFRIEGGAASDETGFSVAGAGDVNGDGRDDVIVGAIGADAGFPARTDAGASYVVYGSTSPATVNLANSLGSRGFIIMGAASSDASGSAVAGAGDVNGDGRDDVIVGARDADPLGRTDAGASYVVYGSASPTTVDLASLGSRGFAIQGAAANDQSGNSVAAAGDVNGDGRDDVIVGAPFAAPFSRTSAGASYVVYGFGTASVSYPGGVTATQGTAITPLAPTVRRTGTAAFSVSPALPAGLSIDSATGVISGTPTTSASADHTVTMTDLSGQATTTVRVAVSAPRAPAAASMTIGKIRVTKTAIITRVTVSGAGVVTQRATRRIPARRSAKGARKPRTAPVCRATASPRAQGALTITCSLATAVRTARKQRALQARLATTFTPTGAAAVSVTKTVKIGRVRR